MELFFEMWDAHLARTLGQPEPLRPTKADLERQVQHVNNELNKLGQDSEAYEELFRTYQSLVYALSDLQ